MHKAIRENGKEFCRFFVYTSFQVKEMSVPLLDGFSSSVYDNNRKGGSAMEYTKRNRAMTLFLWVIGFEYIACNLAHPMTPAIIKTLHLGDYMFGLAFAAMAITNFLFSPFWGKITKNIRLSTLMLISCCGYGAGQCLFMLARNEAMILTARAFSGIFASGYSVVPMIYIVDYSPEGKQGRNLTLMTTLTVVSGAFGYLVGGVLGDISISFCFLIQIAGMVLSGILFFCVMRRNEQAPKKETQQIRILLREANPFSAFLSIRPYFCKALVALFASILCAFIAYNAFEQCFNYYMIDQFDFSTSSNGAVKAVTGIVSLLANLTLCMAILRRRKIDFPLTIMLFLCALFAILMILMPNLIAFLAIAMVFFGCTAVFQPLLQEQVAERSRAQEQGSGVIMGFYNAVKSVGMIFGALVDGFIYDLLPELPFWMAGLFFALAALCSLFYCRLHRRERQHASQGKD